MFTQDTRVLATDLAQEQRERDNARGYVIAASQAFLQASTPLPTKLQLQQITASSVTDKSEHDVYRPPDVVSFLMWGTTRICAMFT